jgi:hypothetical protein
MKVTVLVENSRGPTATDDRTVSAADRPRVLPRPAADDAAVRKPCDLHLEPDAAIQLGVARPERAEVGLAEDRREQLDGALGRGPLEPTRVIAVEDRLPDAARGGLDAAMNAQLQPDEVARPEDRRRIHHGRVATCHGYPDPCQRAGAGDVASSSSGSTTGTVTLRAKMSFSALA